MSPAGSRRRAPRLRPAALRALGIAVTAASALACPRRDDASARPAPTASASAVAAGPCAAGGGAVDDPQAKALLPREAGGYCVDPKTPVTTFGEGASRAIEAGCTDAFGEACAAERARGLTRVTLARYVDGAGRGGALRAVVASFSTSSAAYAAYAARSSSGDPPRARPLAAGTAGAIDDARALVWRDKTLVELRYDPWPAAPVGSKASAAILTLFARDVGARLPGAAELPPEVSALPEDARVAVRYHEADALGVSGIGPTAIGRYEAGGTRWRVLSVVRELEDARRTLARLCARPGAARERSFGDEACWVPASDAGERYLLARRATAIWGVTGAGPSAADAGAPRLLTEAETKSRLLSLMAAPAPTPPRPSASVSPAVSAAVRALSAGIRRPTPGSAAP